jgi:DNA-binding CsgD family transcriptional regulator
LTLGVFQARRGIMDWAYSDAQRELLDEVYLAAVHRERWPSVLDLLARKVGAEAGLLVSEDLTAEEPCWWAATSAHAEEFARVLLPSHRINPWLLAARQKPTPSVARTETLVPLTELRKSAFYRECLEPVGWLHSLGANLFADGPRFAYLSLLRGSGPGPFDDESLVLIGWLSGHLARAVRLQQEFLAASRLSAFLVALDALPQAVVLLGAQCEVVFTNSAANSLIAEDRGLSIVAERLRACDGKGNAELHTRLDMLRDEGTKLEPSQVFSLRRAEALPLVCRLVPLSRPPLYVHGRGVSGMLLVHDALAHARLPQGLLTRTFGLTGAEFRVAEFLVRGQSPHDIAKELGVSHNTVRTHVARLLSKTSTTRQPELVAQLLAFSALGAAQPP